MNLNTLRDVISQLELQDVADLERRALRAMLKLRARIEAGAMIEPGLLNSPD